LLQQGFVSEQHVNTRTVGNLTHKDKITHQNYFLLKNGSMVLVCYYQLKHMYYDLQVEWNDNKSHIQMTSCHDINTVLCPFFGANKNEKCAFESMKLKMNIYTTSYWGCINDQLSLLCECVPYFIGIKHIALPVSLVVPGGES